MHGRIFVTDITVRPVTKIVVPIVQYEITNAKHPFLSVHNGVTGRKYTWYQRTRRLFSTRRNDVSRLVLERATDVVRVRAWVYLRVLQRSGEGE